MPTYEYACRSCGEHLEVVQSFKDDALTVCPNCEGQLRKVFSAAGIIFKGSGWHVKDYASAGSKGGGGSSEPSSSDGDSGASSSDASSGDGSSSGEKSGTEKTAKKDAKKDAPAASGASTSGSDVKKSA